MKFQTPRFNHKFYKYGSISLCMIMKNESRFVSRCINSVRGLVNEIIIVDTGSTDNSVSIAKSKGVKVLHHEWDDDFSTPRNIGISRASCDYIFILDPDEVFLNKDFQALRSLTLNNKYKAFQLVTKNYGRNPTELGFRTLFGESDPTGSYFGFVPSTKTRFWKNGLGIKFEGVFHELADYFVSREKIPVCKKNIFIHHWAHEINQENRLKKKIFYLRLGEKKVRLWPSSGQAWWELAVTEAIAGYRYRAVEHILKAMSLGFGGHNQFFTLSRIFNMLKNKPKANLAFEKGICRLYKNLTHIDSRYKDLKPLNT